jgi:hypothetical protein
LRRTAWRRHNGERTAHDTRNRCAPRRICGFPALRRCIGGPGALLRRDPGAPSIRLFGDLFMTGSGNTIDRIIEQSPNEARYFAGWMPEELAAEVEKGYWYITEPDAALVFAKNTVTMWEDMMRRLGKQPGPRNPGERDARLPARVESAS